MSPLKGAALVTGAGHRLGRAMAVTLASEGFDVVVHYASSKAGAEETAAEVAAKGVNAKLLKADLLDRAAVVKLIPEAVEAIGGPLSVLVNNASIFEYDTVASATYESWDRHMMSNLEAPYFLTQAFAQQVKGGARDENGEPIASACIVNMIDQRVRKLTPEFSTYTIAKMGLWALTQTSARGLAPDIRVNGIGPGPTLAGVRQSDQHFKQQRRNTVLQRGANVEDINNSLRFILSSHSLTGQLLCVDGGQHLGWQTPDILGPE